MPIRLLILEALLRRLPQNHPSRGKIEEDLAKGYSGYWGEQTLDYYVNQFIENEGYFIFQDLRLPTANNSHFQIDTLLLTLNYFLILEGKNIGGTLFFEKDQLLRTQNEVTESFPNPIVQAENQQYHLKRLMEKHSLTIIPNDSFVVITNSKSIIKPNPNYPIAAKKVIRAAALRSKIDWMNNKYQQNILEKKEMQKLARILIKLHTPSIPDFMRIYQISRDEIMLGIYCEDCASLSITRIKRSWICSRCRRKKKNVHIGALIDYALLVNSTITNKKFREFIGIPSVHMASKMLSSLNLPSKGERRHRTYELPVEQLQKRVE